MNASFWDSVPLKSNSKTDAINMLNVFLKCTKENKITTMGYGGRKRVAVGLQGTEDSIPRYSYK